MNTLMLIALILARALRIYSFLIWIRIMLSWFIQFPQPGGFTYYLAKIIDPYLSMFRSKKARLGMLDFSPIIAIGLLEVVQSILFFFGSYGFLTFGYILSLFINAFWSYGISLFLILAGIMLLFRTIASFSQNPMMGMMAERFSIAVTPITDFVRNLFFPPRRRDGSYRVVKESNVNLVSLLLVVLLYFMLSYLLSYLSAFAIRLPF